MRRGEIYRTRERAPERGNKPGFYVVVSRSFIATNNDIATVVLCASLQQRFGPQYRGRRGARRRPSEDMRDSMRLPYLDVQIQAHRLRLTAWKREAGRAQPRISQSTGAGLATVTDRIRSRADTSGQLGDMMNERVGVAARPGFVNVRVGLLFLS